MFLDKIVHGINAVQTVSRLNRKYSNEKKTMVIDFTNNAKEIFKAFNKYRKGSPFEEKEPDPSELQKLYDEISEYGIFSKENIKEFIAAAQEGNDAVFMAMGTAYRNHFNTMILEKEERKDYVNLLLKYIKKYNFIALFYQLPEHLEAFALFADMIAGKLVKLGTESSLKKSLENITVEKAAVKYLGPKANPMKARESKKVLLNPDFVPPKATIQDVVDEIRIKFPIIDGEALIIRQIYDEQLSDEQLVKIIIDNQNDFDYLNNQLSPEIRDRIITAFTQKGYILKTIDPNYKGSGGIIDIMVGNMIRKAIQRGIK